MKSLQTLAICDLNAAVAMPWNTATCISAQLGMRLTGRQAIGSSHIHVQFIVGRTLDIFGGRKFEDVVYLFDRAHNKSRDDYDPKLIAQIRRQLPMEVEVEIL